MPYGDGEGYVHCACPECMEIAIGKPGVALCHDCEEAGCADSQHGCQVEHCAVCGALNKDDCDGCEYREEMS